MSKALAIIPARWGSTRFPGKALHRIAGKELLRRVWERCCLARKLDQVIIATDDMRIAETAFGWGAEVALTSTKHVSGTDRVAEVAVRARGAGVVLNVQGDEPMTNPRLLDRMIECLQDNSSIGIVTAAHPFESDDDVLSPHQVKVVRDLKGNALYFSRSPIPHFRSGLAYILRHQGIYGYRRATLLRFIKWRPSPLEIAESLEQLRALENGVTVHVLLTKHGSPGIDTPADALALEQSLSTQGHGSRPTRSSLPRPRRK
ncbi:MAG: 3-deoxy-manno-octulosonate cytidylyltransferase [Verrucomicrobiota bacterium]